MRNVVQFLSCLCLLLLPGAAAPAASEGTERGVRLVAVGGEDLSIGAFHLLAIAVDKYRDEGLRLQSAVKGARELESVLVEDYSFDKGRCRLLLNADATRKSIIKALRRLAKQAGPDDSVLIYYAGHGHLDTLTNTGSWIPWDATHKTPDRWVGNEEIKGLVKAMKARHVLLVSDSCFAGDFFRSQRTPVEQISDANVRRAFVRSSRRAMTAGGVEPVADGGREGHSIYTWWLLTALREAVSSYVLPEEIHERVRKAVAANAGQKPMYGLLHGAGGEPDGSFVFFRRGTVGLDKAMKEKLRRVEELEKLDREAAAKARRRHEEIVSKQAQVDALDKKLKELQGKLGITGGQGDLDGIIAMMEERERREKELEALRKKAEAELRAKEEALAEEQRKKDEKLRKRFEADLAKYEKIVAGRYATKEMKAEAWRILCRTWGVPEGTPAGTPLRYRGGKALDATEMEMVLIRAGSFMMGSPEGEEGRDSGEGPMHRVEITKPFYMAEVEVTVGLFRRFVDETSYVTDAEQEGSARILDGKKWTDKKGASWRAPGFTQGEDNPVTCVSWNDAVRFCNWLSEKEGRKPSYKIKGESVTWDRNADGYRLPTEAEWEYACRAGTTTRFFAGDSEGALGGVGWYFDNSGFKTHPVGKKAPNAWDLYDMHGNVWEWCWDWHGDYPSTAVTDPAGPVRGSYRVFRGGSWNYYARFCRSADRNYARPADRRSFVGLRLLRPKNP